MLSFDMVEIPFSDLFTDTARNTFKRLLQNEHLRSLRIDIPAPVGVFKNEYREVYEQAGASFVPITVFLDWAGIVNKINDEYGLNISPDEKLEHGLDYLIKKQCQVVSKLFVLH